MMQAALKVLFPGQCVACGALVEDDFALCGACWLATPFIDGLVCDACGVPMIGETAGARPLCDACLETPRPWDKGRAALLYQGKARSMILALKHGDRTQNVKPAARWMAVKVPVLLPPGGVIVPIPLHWTRLVKRRYNQAALLARGIAEITGHNVVPDGLIRPKRTGSQEGRSRDERFRALRGAMAVHPGRIGQLTGRPILIVDDVMTSGGTFAEATRALQAAGTGTVTVLSLARVAKDL